MSLLLVDDGSGDVETIESVGIALTTGQLAELRRKGRTEFDADDGTTVVIGHEDALNSLVEEVA